MILADTYFTSLFQAVKTLQNLSKSDKQNANDIYSINSSQTSCKWEFSDRGLLFISSSFIAYILI